MARHVYDTCHGRSAGGRGQQRGGTRVTGVAPFFLQENGYGVGRVQQRVGAAGVWGGDTCRGPKRRARRQALHKGSLVLRVRSRARGGDVREVTAKRQSN